MLCLRNFSYGTPCPADNVRSELTSISATKHIGHDHIGTYETISATRNVHIGHRSHQHWLKQATLYVSLAYMQNRLTNSQRYLVNAKPGTNHSTNPTNPNGNSKR